MGVNAEAIHGTRPWKIFGVSPAVAATAEESASFNENKRKDLSVADIRFTTKGGALYAFVMGWPDYDVLIRPLALSTHLRVGKIQNVELLGYDGKLEWSQDDKGLRILTPSKSPCEHAVAFKVTGA
jgi:alpha-L-fucosidase